MADVREIIERINDSIQEVVEHYGVDLKKRGANYTACCPFHHEKTPSFSVHSGKGIYKCFGCGKGGDAVSFIQEQEGLGSRQGKDFIEIIKKGAKIFNLDFQQRELTDEEKERQRKKDAMKIATQKIVNSYAENLLKEEHRPIFEYVFDRIVPKPFIESTIDIIPKPKLYKPKKGKKLNLIPTKAYLQAVEYTDIYTEFYTFLEQWKIGWANGHDMVKYAKSQGIKNQILEDCGILKYHKTTNNYTDFFNNRVSFPVFDIYGNAIAISARLHRDEKGAAKYKNSSDSPIFHKSEALYGIHIAKRYMKEWNNVNLVEGNTDMLRLQWIGAADTVAALGTALTLQHIEAIQRYTHNVTLIYDGDKAGLKALEKNGLMMLKEGMSVYMILLPDGQDPADLFYSWEQYDQYRKKHKEDFLIYIAKKEFNDAGQDIRKKQQAIEKIADLLYPMSELIRNLYIQQLMKISGTKSKEWSSLISRKKKAKERLQRKNQNFSNVSMGEEQERMLENYSFYYTDDNRMFFRGEGNSLNEKGRFTIHPLFHIESADGMVRKLFRLKNYKGEEDMLETDIGSLQSPVKLAEKLEEKGNYVFEGGKIELTRLKRWLYDLTKYSSSVDVLGWHKAGFWAWSDGIINQEGTFKETDEYGMVEFDNRFYYIPAYSILNKESNEFMEQKKFSYAIQEVSFKAWSQAMLDVYGKNAMLSIAAYTATVFADHIFEVTRAFPLLNFFGPKGSGKTEHAFSISALFGTRLKEMNISNTTASGMGTFLNAFRNTCVLIDEYKNSLRPDMIEALKGLWNRQSRTRSKFNSGNNRIGADNNSAINAVAMIAGQEMMTADIALFSRAIFLPSYKTTYTDNERKSFTDLKEIQDKGLAHLTSELIVLRKEFEVNYAKELSKTAKELKEKANNNIEERLLKNHSIVLTAFRMVSKKFDFAFSYDQLVEESVANLAQQYKLMSSSNEISGFFKVLTSMFEQNIIKDEYNYSIKTVTNLNKGEQTLTFTPEKTLLFLRWEGIYQRYAELGNKGNENVMPEQSLRYYLENSSVFIANHKTRFKGVGARWALVFDYELCEEMGLFLTRDDDGQNTDEQDGIIAGNLRTVHSNGEEVQILDEPPPF